MDNERLIELVREHTCLYDITDKRYSDNQKKDAAWKEISKKLRVQDRDCKKTWALLRDSFRRAIKKQKETNSSQGNVICKKWKYYDEMEFLLPFIKERHALFTATPQNEDHNDYDVNLDGEASISSVDHPPDKVTSDNNPFRLTISTAANSANIMCPSKRHRRSSSNFKKRVSEEMLSTALMKYILDNKQNTDDIEQFFGCMATTVKSFPPRERAIAKAKVFELISKMEIDILNNPPTYSGKQSPMSFYSNDSSGRSSCNLLSDTNATTTQ